MLSVKIAFVGIIPMAPHFNQSGMCYVYIFLCCEVIAFGYINRLFVKVVLFAKKHPPEFHEVRPCKN